MRGLLLAAHGSRRAESNDEVRRLTARLAKRCGARFALVSCAFLELAEPAIADELRRHIEGGVDEALVLPYFLAAGNHVRVDIPAQIAPVQAAHPEARIRLLDHCGGADEMPELLARLAADV